MIEYACKHCGEGMSSPDSMTGKLEMCPHCQYLTRVPADDHLHLTCTHCGEPMTSSPDRIGRFEACPACSRRVKVLDPAVLAERKWIEETGGYCSDRQLAFASNVGLKANASMTAREVSRLLTSWDRVKHYINGLIIHLTDSTAADVGIPRVQIEEMAAAMVNASDPFVPTIYETVGDDGHSSEFIEPRTALYREMSIRLFGQFPELKRRLR